MNNAKTIGYWSAVISLLFALGYSVAQLLSTFKMLPHPQDLFWLFLPSLFLAPPFVVTMICLHYSVSENLKIWTAIGVAFAIMYGVLVDLVYFSQLTVVVPAQLRGEINETHVLIFGTKTFLMAVDCLGYFFMSLSTLFAAFAFRNQVNRKWLYRGMLYNGLLLPVIIFAFFYPLLYYIGALWMITFPLAMIQAIWLFQKFTPAKTL
ncbi:MAG: hypothetical protein SFU99_10105 [Saprospiraceae bacterium]|nr:hypothetical protein [Saprospiraceae bacterium]